MMTTSTWQERYGEALLELRPEELPRRIEIAEKAISERLEELARSGDASGSEQQVLNEAMRALRVVAQSECRNPKLAERGLGRSGAA
jgi:hypothetical protein